MGARITKRADFDGMGVKETPQVELIEQAIADSTTFQVLIGQSGNDAAACARDIARDVARAINEHCK